MKNQISNVKKTSFWVWVWKGQKELWFIFNPPFETIIVFKYLFIIQIIILFIFQIFILFIIKIVILFIIKILSYFIYYSKIYFIYYSKRERTSNVSKRTSNVPKRTRNVPKRTRNVPKRTKGLFVPKIIKKYNKRLKTSRVSPWGFMPVEIIIVFFLFYKVNEKSSF